MDNKDKFFTAKNDNVFKAIFCNENNTFLLKTLIERCLKIKIEIIEIHAPEKIKENIYAKGQILDVLVKNYLDMNEVIQINFTWGLPRKYSILGEYLLVDKKTGIKFVDNFSIFEYNMDKIRELWYSGDKEYEFLAILDFNKEELKKIGKGDEYMSEFKKKIESLNDNSLGIEESKVEIAKKLLKENIDEQIISKVTGLSMEKIRDLK